MQSAAPVEPGRIRIGAAANRAAGPGRAIQPRPAVSRGRRRRLLRAAGRPRRRAGRPAWRGVRRRDLQGVGPWTATVWSEECEGANGIGTCLAEQRALTVHRDQHFYARNTLLSCTSAPIYDHEGRLAAALDVSSCRADLTEGFVGLIAVAVGDAARRIEMENFRLAFPNARFLFAPDSNRGGGGLIAVDADDLVIGATRSARLALGVTRDFLKKPLPAAACSAAYQVRRGISTRPSGPPYNGRWRAATAMFRPPPRRSASAVRRCIESCAASTLIAALTLCPVHCRSSATHAPAIRIRRADS